jgi:hypothetical protein
MPIHSRSFAKENVNGRAETTFLGAKVWVQIRVIDISLRGKVPCKDVARAAANRTSSIQVISSQINYL